MTTLNNENPSMCSACGGACCKRFAGIFLPDQLELTPENICKMLEGDYALDCWDGDPRIDRRPIGKDHPDWFDYEEDMRKSGRSSFSIEGANERYNTEDYLAYPGVHPEITNVSQVYYLRPKHKSINTRYNPNESVEDTVYRIKNNILERVNTPVDRSWGGTCVLLTDTGCSLKFEDRPIMCQKLKPNYNFETKENDCGKPEDDLDKRGYMFRWMPHQEVLEKGLDLYYRNKSSKEIFVEENFNGTRKD
jgi:hypothetical protein